MLIHGELNPSPTMPKGQNMIMSPRNIKVLMKGSNTFPSTKINEEEQRTKETKNGKIHMENIANLANDFLCEYIDEKKKNTTCSFLVYRPFLAVHHMYCLYICCYTHMYWPFIKSLPYFFGLLFFFFLFNLFLLSFFILLL